MVQQENFESLFMQMTSSNPTQRIAGAQQLRGVNLRTEIPLLSASVHLEAPPAALRELFLAYARLLGSLNEQAQGSVDDTLIDALYEAGQRLLCPPARPPASQQAPPLRPRSSMFETFDFNLTPDADFAPPRQSAPLEPLQTSVI